MMKSDRMRPTWGLLLVIAGVAALYVVQHGQTAHLRDDLARVEALAKAASNQSAHAATIERIIVREAPAPSSAVSNVPEMRTPAPVVAQDDRIRSREAVSGLVAWHFEKDPPDKSAASREAFQTIETAISAHEKDGVQLESLECRRQLCRAVVDFRNRETDQSVMRALFRGNREIRMGGVLVPDRQVESDGRVKATVYIARRGDVPVD
jgi:hypothetical protein